ncbi:MAG: hypothetical protein ACE5ID_00130 [Acidobacteriota bacterium]
MASPKKHHALLLAGILVLGLFGFSSSTGAAELHTALSAGVTVGYDSNPLLISSSVQGGGFSNLDLSATADLTFNRRFGLFLDLSGEERTHEESLSDADYHWLDVRAGLDLVPYRGDAGYLVVSTGASFGMRRQIFTDRATGGLPFHRGSHRDTAADPGHSGSTGQ